MMKKVKAQKPMKIFLGLTEVSGFFSKVSTGLNVLGHQALHVPLQSHPFEYSDNKNLPFIPRIARHAVRLRVEALGKNRQPYSYLLAAYALITRILLFLWVIKKFDLIILGGGSSFFNFHEFKIFRLLGKKVIYTLHGTDARPPYIDGFFEPESYSHLIKLPAGKQDALTVIDYMERVAQIRSRRVRIIEKGCSVVVCPPNICHFLTKPFVDFNRVGLPATASRPIFRLNGNVEDRNLRVAHAPSRRKGKGSEFILSIVEDLKRQGYNFEYYEIMNARNSELIEFLKTCDLVIDQAFSDTPVAGLAAEASALGVPVLVGGYYAEYWKKHTPLTAVPPVVFCRPDQMKDRLAELLADHTSRVAIGQKAYEFMSAYWSEIEVAKRLLMTIDHPPKSWLVNPDSVFYCEGIGLQEEIAAANVRQLIERFGTHGLHLGGKGSLESAFTKFSLSFSSHTTGKGFIRRGAE